ncbi:stress transcription factor A [Seminavis robusta]|uniref:Stress transcription factor A n=1 Tax=Seminavis robusta TaxID=568900 RepID=A0A9N8EFS7_9STRA|nr:stress transcription factor A [Seminavis robusta]|eukprot:Sro1029_g233310.1 stress transcription factor A (448) ;mRNA; f:26789-28335
MGDDHGEATVVSNSSSRGSFVGLPGAGDVATNEWELTTVNKHTHHDAFNNTNNNQHQHSGQPYFTAESMAANVSQNSTPNLTSAMPSSFPATLIVSKNPLPILPSAGLAVPAAPANNTVPEFLYQLTKMLTGGHNEIIEWSNGRIEVHNPHKLESAVLQKYFRHSKFASFQRQLNYFGFRKLAGKGKMAPCSYVNEAATHDIGSLLLIKRKPTTNPREKNGRKSGGDKQFVKAGSIPPNTAQGMVHQVSSAPPNPVATVSYTNTVMKHEPLKAPAGSSQQAIAQAAVGRGIRHSIGYDSSATASAAAAVARVESSATATATTEGTSFFIPTGVQDSLSQLANNYQNSLAAESPYPDKAPSQPEAQPAQESSDSYNEPFPSLLSRNSSLIDLAMIPTMMEGDEEDGMPTVPGMSFVDFPQPEVDPSNATAYRAKLEATKDQAESQTMG